MVLLAGISVRGDGRLLAPVNLAKVGFSDVGTQPDVIEIGEGDDRRSGRNHFAQFGLAHGDDAGGRSVQSCIGFVDAREGEIRIGLIKIGAGDGDIFFAAAFLGLVVSLLRGREVGFRALERGCRQVAVLRGDFILGKELLGAIVVELFFVEIGLRSSTACARL